VHLGCPSRWQTASMTRRLLPLALVSLALGAAACSSSASSSSSTTVPATTSTSRAVTTTSKAAASTTSTTTAGPSRCTNASLTVSAGASSGSAGHVNTPVIFTNSSMRPCTLFGYPGVAGLDASGSQAAQATRTATPGPTHLVVAPGATASALVINTSIPSGNQTTCPTWSGLLVTPPNLTASTKLTLQVPGCSGFTVSAVVAGSNGI